MLPVRRPFPHAGRSIPAASLAGEFLQPGLPAGARRRFQGLAERYELAGGAIINVLRHAALMAAQHAPAIVHAHDLLDGIRLELQKDGRYLSR